MIVKAAILLLLSVSIFPSDGFGQEPERPDLDRLIERENLLALEEQARAGQKSVEAGSQISTPVKFEELFGTLMWSISKNEKIGELLMCDAEDLREISRIETEYRNRIERIDPSSVQGQIDYGNQLASFRKRVTDILGEDRSQRAGVIAAKLACNESAPDFLCVLAVMEFVGPTDNQLSSTIESYWAEYRQKTLDQIESGVGEIKRILPPSARVKFDEILSISLNTELKGVNSKSNIEFVREKVIEALFFENEFSANTELVDFQKAGLERLLLKMNQDEEFQAVHRIELEFEKNGTVDASIDMRELRSRRQAITSRLLRSLVADIENELLPHQYDLIEVASLFYFAKSRDKIPFAWPVILEKQLQLNSTTVHWVQKRADLLTKKLITSQAKLSAGYLRSIKLASSDEMRQKLDHLDAILLKDITRDDLNGKTPRLSGRQ